MDVSREAGSVGGGESSVVFEVNVVVVDELLRQCEQRDVASETAVVEPVDSDGRNAIDLARGVDGDDDEVAAGLQDRGHLAVEWRVAALVIADALLIDPDKGLVVGRTDVEEGAGAGPGLEVKVALVPDDALEAKERRLLSVPVTGDLESGRGGEVVFRIVWAGVDIGVGVEGVAIVADLAVAGVEVAGGRLINQVVPIAVERGDAPMVDADEKRSQRLLGRGGKSEGAAG